MYSKLLVGKKIWCCSLFWWLISFFLDFYWWNNVQCKRIYVKAEKTTSVYLWNKNIFDLQLFFLKDIIITNRISILKFAIIFSPVLCIIYVWPISSYMLVNTIFPTKGGRKKGIFDIPHEKLISSFNNLLKMVWTFSSLIT